MASIIIPSRGAPQPPVDSRIDAGSFSCPLTFAHHAGGAIDLVSGKTLSVTGSTPPFVYGGLLGSISSGSTGYLSVSGRPPIRSGAITTLHVFSLTAKTTYETIRTAIADPFVNGISPAFYYYGSQRLYASHGGGSNDTDIGAWSPVMVVVSEFGNAANSWKARVNGGSKVTISNGPSGTVWNTNQTYRVHAIYSGNLRSTATAPLYLFAVFDGLLTDSEQIELGRNPWQLFRPISNRSIFIGLASATTGPTVYEDDLEADAGVDDEVSALFGRLGHPRADVSNTGWLPSSGSDLYPMVDEGVREDSDYVYTTAPAVARIALTQHADPGDTVHAIKIASPAGYSPSGTLVVRLYCGATQIAEWTITDLSADDERTLTLTAGERDSITDYTALEIELEAVAV